MPLPLRMWMQTGHMTVIGKLALGYMDRQAAAEEAEDMAYTAADMKIGRG